jgi:hypothetical protein
MPYWIESLVGRRVPEVGDIIRPGDYSGPHETDGTPPLTAWETSRDQPPRRL